MMTRLDKTLLTASFLSLFPIGLLLPIYAIFVKHVGGDVLDAGIAFGLFSFSSGLFVLLVTKTKIFRNNLRLMIVCGYTLVLVGQVGYFFVQTPMHLFLTQIIIGIATGILDPAWDSLFSLEKTEAHATLSWSLWQGGQRMVTGLGAIAGALIIVSYSFTLLFSVMFVLNLLAVLISLKLLVTHRSTK